MDFDLSDDQAALADAATELLDDRCPPARVRAVHESGSGWDPELWAHMVEQGWLGVTVPEVDGGLGLGLVEAGILVEQIGAHVAPVPFLPTVVAIEVLRRSNATALAERVVAGAAPACVAWSSGTATLRAEHVGSGWTLTGRSDPVPFAPVADVAVVCAPDADGAAVFLIDLATVGRPRREPAMDLSQPLGWLELDDAPAVRLGGADLAAFVTDVGATGSSLSLLGAAQTVLTMTVDYAKERVQFGRPIGSFQAVKHRCADMLVDVEGMRSGAYWAAWCLAVEDPDRSIAASTAKTWSADASKRVMASGLQVHGGIGFTWEHDLHLFLKRSQLDQLCFGDAVWHRARLGTLLRAKVDAGTSVL
jgi:alkylation response protein AidB-like acyl-CoA dehydrogenase